MGRISARLEKSHHNDAFIIAGGKEQFFVMARGSCSKKIVRARLIPQS